MQEWHKYDASDFSYLDSLGYDRIIEEAQQERYSIRSLSNFSSLHSSLDCRTDADLDPMAPLCIGMDYNANINWIVCGQPRGNRLNVLKSFYVKFERKIPALIADFCTYYAPHANHSVIYYYDTTALGSNYAVNDQDFNRVVVHEFERHGWSVQDVYLGNPMRHDEKYLLVNQGFSDKQRDSCLISIARTMMTLFLPYKAQEWNAVAMAFAKTSPRRRIPNLRRTCWSIAPMVQMLSIRCILGVKSFLNMIFMGEQGIQIMKKA